MTDDIDAWANDIHCGDVHETLAEMPESSVHMAMCSPPYFGLRDYDADGQIGLEDSLDEYIAELVAVGDELRRVLRDDGSWWLNLGDSFSQSGRNNDGKTSDRLDGQGRKRGFDPGGFGPKNKMLVPHRVAIALQDAGWIVRNDVVWDKAGSGMPESVTDRLSKSFEYVFHLTPAPDYWYDLDAIREPHAEASVKRAAYGKSESAPTDDPNYGHNEANGANAAAETTEHLYHPSGKNPGDIFRVTTKPFPEAHFAVYPPELCETPIKATCPPTVCAGCGTPYERVTEETPVWDIDPEAVDRPQLERALELADNAGLTTAHFEACRSVGVSDAGQGEACQDGAGRNTDEKERLAAEAKDALGGYFREFTTVYENAAGWTQACECATDATEAGIALDPFAGAGTTCLVAKRLGRRFCGIDLNPDYVAMAQQRVGVTVSEPDRLREAGETALTDFGGGDDD